MVAKLLSVDLLAGLGAGAWAVAAHLWIPELAELADPRLAGGFALLALGRWYVNARKKS